MAFTNTVSYSGKQSFEYFSPALFSNEFLGRFQVIDGVTVSANLPQVSLTGTIVDDACNFTDAGNITISPRVLTTCAYKMNKEICRSDIEPGFLSERLRGGAFGEPAPQDFTDYIVDLAVEQIGNEMQNKMWGSTASCQGLLVQWGGTGATATFANGVVGVTAAAAGVTAGNVIAEMTKVYEAIPSAVLWGAEKPILMVAPNVATAYTVAQANTTGGLFMVGEKVLNFNGLEVVAAPNMPNSRMVAARASNIYLGVDMFNDMQSIKVIDVSDTLGYDAVRLAARWRFGVQSGINAEIVYYG